MRKLKCKKIRGLNASPTGQAVQTGSGQWQDFLSQGALFCPCSAHPHGSTILPLPYHHPPAPTESFMQSLSAHSHTHLPTQSSHHHPIYPSSHHLPIYLSIHSSVLESIHLSFYPFIYPSILLSLHLAFNPFIYLSIIHPSFCPFIYLLIHSFILAPIFPSIPSFTL